MLLTRNDHERLRTLLRSMRSSATYGNAISELANKLAAATLVVSDSIPGDVVTMNSVVRLSDLQSGSTIVCSLVFPNEADVDAHKISVLARLGVELLGGTEGSTIEYRIPTGTKQFRIQKIIHQPESRFRHS